jgi:hypothetical protein
MLSACDATAPRTAVDRETFVAVYVELRLAALSSPTGRITPALRDRILAGGGIDEEALLQFVEAHGRDVDYMAALWTEVEERIENPSPPTPDGAS